MQCHIRHGIEAQQPYALRAKLAALDQRRKNSPRQRDFAPRADSLQPFDSAMLRFRQQRQHTHERIGRSPRVE